ncbi:MAG: helix-turn-helix transcriptional regulator [Polyangiaceae bacterium]|nr:helix-turn-helix transcriptional regulator [Polyangiaceae bacterium]
MSPRGAKLAARLGAGIRRHRRSLGFTQAALADKLGSSTEYVSLLVPGRRLPSVPMLVDLAHVLGASLDELLTKEADEARSTSVPSIVASVPRDVRPYVYGMLQGIARVAAQRRRRRR